MDQSGLDCIQIHKTDGVPCNLINHYVVDLGIPMHRSELQLALLPGILKDMSKCTSLLDKIETIVHFRALSKSIVRKCPVEVLKVARHNVKTFQRVRKQLDGQIADQVLECAEGIAYFASESCVFDRFEGSCPMYIADGAPKIALSINVEILSITGWNDARHFP